MCIHLFYDTRRVDNDAAAGSKPGPGRCGWVRPKGVQENPGSRGRRLSFTCIDGTAARAAAPSPATSRGSGKP